MWKNIISDWQASFILVTEAQGHRLTLIKCPIWCVTFEFLSSWLIMGAKNRMFVGLSNDKTLDIMLCWYIEKGNRITCPHLFLEFPSIWRKLNTSMAQCQRQHSIDELSGNSSYKLSECWPCCDISNRICHGCPAKWMANMVKQMNTIEQNTPIHPFYGMN